MIPPPQAILWLSLYMLWTLSVILEKLWRTSSAEESVLEAAQNKGPNLLKKTFHAR